MKKTLLKSFHRLIQVDTLDYELIHKTSTDLIIALMKSDSKEIKELLEFIHNNYYMECPFWVRVTAFRILLALNPNDRELKEWAIGNFSMFGGPSWKNEVLKW